MLAVLETESNGPETTTESTPKASTTNYPEVSQETCHKLNAHRRDNSYDTSRNQDDNICENSEVVDSLEIANTNSNRSHDFKSDSPESFQKSGLKMAFECPKEPGHECESFQESKLEVTPNPGDQPHSCIALCDSKTAPAVGAQNSASESNASGDTAATLGGKNSMTQALGVIPEISEASPPRLASSPLGPPPSPLRPASLQIKTTARPLNIMSSIDINGQIIRSVKSCEKDNAMSDNNAMPILNVKSTKCQSNVVVKSDHKKGFNSPNNEGTIGQNATCPTRTALPMESGLETYEYSFGPSKNRPYAAPRTTTTTNSDNTDRDSNNKELMCFNPSDKCNPARRPISRLPTISTRHSRPSRPRV